MKKLLLAIFLTIISTNAFAKWTMVDRNETGDSYVDIASKRKVGNKVKIWKLNDLKAPQTAKGFDKPFLSFVSYYEYDCINATSRLLAINFYTKNMQQGKSFNNFTFGADESSDDQIIPNSLEATSWNLACGKNN